MFNYAVIVIKNNEVVTTEINVVAENVEEVMDYCLNLDYEIIELRKLNKVNVVIKNG